MPSVEWSINIGTVVVLVFTAGGFYTITKQQLKSLDDNMKAIKADLSKLNEVVTAIAVQNSRLDNQGAQLTQLRDEINLIRQGRGFIQPRIDGEYGNR